MRDRSDSSLRQCVSQLQSANSPAVCSSNSSSPVGITSAYRGHFMSLSPLVVSVGCGLIDTTKHWYAKGNPRVLRLGFATVQRHVYVLSPSNTPIRNPVLEVLSDNLPLAFQGLYSFSEAMAMHGLFLADTFQTVPKPFHKMQHCQNFLVCCVLIAFASIQSMIAASHQAFLIPCRPLLM